MDKEVIHTHGLDIYCSTTDMNIIDSYNINNIDEMKSILMSCLMFTKIYKTDRTMNSLINEWIAHNKLYKYNLYRNHTKDCNFENKEKIHIRFIYFILSRTEKFKYYITGGTNGRKRQK